MLHIDPQCVQRLRRISYAAARALWTTSSVTVTGSPWSSSRVLPRPFSRRYLARRWSTGLSVFNLLLRPRWAGCRPVPQLRRQLEHYAWPIAPRRSGGRAELSRTSSFLLDRFTRPLYPLPAGESPPYSRTIDHEFEYRVVSVAAGHLSGGGAFRTVLFLIVGT
jgi:hypothetical protein